MRAILIVSVLLLVSFAGCAESAPGEGKSNNEFKDVDVDVDDEHGVIFGVVVDTAIVPLDGVKISTTIDGQNVDQISDSEGRFVFDRVPAGTYFLASSKLGYESAQVSVSVEAGVEDPNVVKVQMAPTFSGTPYMTPFQFSGRITCSYSFTTPVGGGVTAPCITDYTSIAVGGGAAPQLREVQGDVRDWVTEINPGWKSHITEMMWESSAQGTSDALGVTISFEGRLASHWYSSTGGVSPMLSRLDQGVTHPTNQGDPAQIPEEGLPNLLSFVAVRLPEGEYTAVSVEQDFEAFTHTFYNVPAPEGWSFLAGDASPF